MSVQLKSHVLRREEKGLAGIPLKRLLLAGAGGSLVYVFTQATGIMSFGFGIFASILLLVMTSPRGGIPRWQRLWYAIRSDLISAKADHTQGLKASLNQLLSLPTDLKELDGDSLFKSHEEANRTSLTAWRLFTRTRGSTGLTFAEPPGIAVTDKATAE